MFWSYTLQTKNFTRVIEKLKISHLGYLFDKEYVSLKEDSDKLEEKRENFGEYLLYPLPLPLSSVLLLRHSFKWFI